MLLAPWLAAQLLAAWCGLHSQIQINSLSLFIPEKINSIVFSSMKERAAQVDLICSFHFNCCFLFISLVDRLRLSSLWASCLGAGPPIQTHQKRIQLGCLFSAPRFIEEFHVDWCCCSLFLCGAVRQLPPLTHKEKNNPINTHSSYAAWGPLLFNSSFFFIPLILKERKWKEKKRVD